MAVSLRAGMHNMPSLTDRKMNDRKIMIDHRRRGEHASCSECHFAELGFSPRMTSARAALFFACRLSHQSITTARIKIATR